ncbi:hypothetical protein RvY_05830 [Ramazzottius varieornatus]|uniref:Ubiquitin-like domain-containing protein n=1 Tax=Ramazzottius varieornatus TaxID=947166 RepID=A0A1D1UZE6_RAMVA|nr:hypothetical protein RvY_05830 [Ramazzottius varieornatus]
MQDDDEELWEYNLMTDSVLHLIKVVLPDGQAIVLNVEPVCQTIKDPKKMVQSDAPKFVADGIELVFCGKLLKDEATLLQVGISSSSQLKLVQYSSCWFLRSV